MGSSQSSPSPPSSPSLPRQQDALSSAFSLGGGGGGGSSSSGTGDESADNKKGSSSSSSSSSSTAPSSSSSEQEIMDYVASQLPQIVDEESQRQIADFRQACNNGKGPMVACYSTAEYLNVFENKFKEAYDLYNNVCFRPITDKSPYGETVDGTKAYPPGCFSMAKMLFTGRGKDVPQDPYKAYQVLDRACRGDHGGSCFLQAQILLSEHGLLGDDRIPHNPKRALELYELTCDKYNDPLSCFMLATALLRGDKVSHEADNVTSAEARGQVPLVQRKNEPNRARKENAPVEAIPRDPVRAEHFLKMACDRHSHVTACHNLAVMYSTGDEGVPADPEKAAYYKKKTEERLHIFGGF